MRNGYDPGSPNYDPGPPDYNPSPAFKVGSGYGFRKDPIKKFGPANEPDKKKRLEFHSGQDYVAPAGTPIPSAASGVVVYSGFNNNLGNTVIVRNDRGDYSLYGHMQDGDRAKRGQRIGEGDTIGSVGGTGARATGVHLHYSVIRPEAGKIIEKGPGNGGSIGIHLDGFTTNDPIGPPRFLDQSQRAAEIISGSDKKSLRNDGLPPDRPGNPFFSPFNQSTPAVVVPSPSPANQNPVADRFDLWGSAPAANAPVASQDPADFNDRYGNWGSSPSGVLGNIGAPDSRAPDQGRRSEIPGHVTQDAAQWTADDDSAPARMLSRLNVSPALPSSDAPPLTPAAPPPLLGIFSGKPMPDYPVWPSIFNTNDRSSSGNDELYRHWRRWLDA